MFNTWLYLFFFFHSFLATIAYLFFLINFKMNLSTKKTFYYFIGIVLHLCMYIYILTCYIHELVLENWYFFRMQIHLIQKLGISVCVSVAISSFLNVQNRSCTFLIKFMPRYFIFLLFCYFKQSPFFHPIFLTGCFFLYEKAINFHINIVLYHRKFAYHFCQFFS